MAQENVNHPQHYNQHPAGIECIDVIRHYTCDIANAIKYIWRAGLKSDADKTDIEKELEDLEKALWYIEDYSRNSVRFCHLLTHDEVGDVVYEVTGYRIDLIVKGYVETVSIALSNLLAVGIIFQGEVRHIAGWRDSLAVATEYIQARLGWLERQTKED